MGLFFRNIVELLEIDAPVHYTPREKLDKAGYVFCRWVGEAAAEAMQKDIYNPNADYDNSDAGLHFPDLEISEYYDLESRRNPVAQEWIIREISKVVKVHLSEIPFVYAVYCVLHEYGHWRHFIDSGKTVWEYREMEKEARLPYEKLANEIYKMPDNDPRKITLAKHYEEEIYRKFPSEQAADKFALAHIQGAIDKIRCSLG